MSAKLLFATSVAAASVASALARTFTVKNNCAYTVWPAIFTDLNAGTAVPDHPTGWEAPPGHSTSFNVPDNWTAGRIWGRTDCDFSIAAPPEMCSSGGCNGGLECDRNSGTGVPPATVAEWTLSASDDLDWYDVSLVDGFNIPVRIDTSADCQAPECAVDLNPNCPAELKSPNGLGCRSACEANIDGNQQDSGNCCSGSHDTPATCPPEGVDFYDYFKDNCPTSYAYAYDESSGTALWTCPMANQADYTVTFCP